MGTESHSHGPPSVSKGGLFVGGGVRETDDVIAELRSAGVHVIDWRGRLEENEQAPAWRKRKPESLLGLVVHHSAGEARDWRGPGHVVQVDSYHRGGNHIADGGMRSAVYPWFGLGDGSVIVHRNFDEVTWAQGDRATPGDENELLLAYCVLGDLSSATHQAGEPTLAQIITLTKVWAACKVVFSFTDANIYGHADFGKAECPGAALMGVIRAIRANARRTPAYGLQARLLREAGFGELEHWRERQKALIRLGYELPRYGADGDFGAETRRALRAFQKARSGLPNDGRWGVMTAEYLRRELAGLLLEAA